LTSGTTARTGGKAGKGLKDDIEISIKKTTGGIQERDLMV